MNIVLDTNKRLHNKSIRQSHCTTPIRAFALLNTLSSITGGVGRISTIAGPMRISVSMIVPVTSEFVTKTYVCPPSPVGIAAVMDTSEMVAWTLMTLRPETKVRKEPDGIAEEPVKETVSVTEGCGQTGELSLER